MPPDTSKIAPTPNATGWAAPKRHASSTTVTANGLLDELRPIFDELFAGRDHIVLAVSGGSDSTALMHLAVAWHRETAVAGGDPPVLSVVTIDHGLRPESGAEATDVQGAASALGLRHARLHWDGPKPTTGVQAAAREARRRLLGAYLGQNNWSAVAFAHTSDDQAETFLMRLARGSGVDGLGAMRYVSPLDLGQSILRPLLGVSKQKLVDYLTAHEIRWIEDPSNQSSASERVRMRAFFDTATVRDVGLERTSVARSAARIARASAALTEVAGHAWVTRGENARFDIHGFAIFSWQWLMLQPEEIRLRLLAGLINRIGGQLSSVSLGQLEAATVRRKWHFGCLHGKTLHGTQIDCRPQQGELGSDVVIMREAGRQWTEPLELTPGHVHCWDRRFLFKIDRRCPAGVWVAPLGLTDGFSDRDQRAVPSVAWQAQPALWMRDGVGAQVLAGVPLAGFFHPALVGMVQCKTLLPEF